MEEDEPTLREIFGQALEIWERATSAAEYAEIWPLLDSATKFDEEAMAVGEYFLTQGDVAHRALAADMLGRVAVAHESHRVKIADLLLERLLEEDDPDVCWSAITALGATDDPRGIEALTPWTNVGHTVLRTRTLQVLTYLQRNGRHTEEGVAAVLDFLEDPEPVLRHTAAAALAGSLKADGKLVRDDLAKRLFDLDDETRREAIVALAVRRDDRARSALAAALEAPKVSRRIFDAAAALADPRLLPLVDTADHSELSPEDLQRVRAACRGRSE